LMAYDRRHGWRGPVTTFETIDAWAGKLGGVTPPSDMPGDWRLAVVLETGSAQARIGFADGKEDALTLEGARWARKSENDGYALGPEITAVSQVVSKGDVVMVERASLTPDQDPEIVDPQSPAPEAPKEGYILRQIPRVQGALIAMDPHTGRVLAMQGGWMYGQSVFNRATQAKRQPGSAFKPFIYLAALDKGFTPATRVLDAPFVIEQAPGDFWRPTNYTDEFYGPTPIRVGVEKSRNLMTVRLADHVGMDTVVDYAQKFGIADNMKPYLSYALGAGETTLLRLTSAYAMLVNGGKKITPSFVDRIQDRRGNTIFSHDGRPCPNCGDLIRWEGQGVPTVSDNREQIGDPRTTYQMVSILEGVVQRGTGRSISTLGYPLAGKTGTTNESKDTWFIGFSPDLAVGVFVGFDEPRSMGKKETGGSAAAPIFKAFMKEALKNPSATPFRVPPGVRNMRINASTGRAARPGDSSVSWEAFVTGSEPNADDYVLDTKVISGGAMVDPGRPQADPAGYGFASGDEGGAAADPGVPSYGMDSYGGAPFDSFNGGNAGGVETYPAPDQRAPDPAFTGTGGLY